MSSSSLTIFFKKNGKFWLIAWHSTVTMSKLKALIPVKTALAVGVNLNDCARVDRLNDIIPGQSQVVGYG